MSRVMERQDQQINNLKRAADRFNLEEEVMTIKYDRNIDGKISDRFYVIGGNVIIWMGENNILLMLY